MTDKTIVIVVQARMGSSRLPGKVLKEVDGKPLLWYLLKKLDQLKHKSKILLATTLSPGDAVLEDFAKKNKINVYRGSENDVLDRYYQGVKNLNADIVVRITADCPLMDASIIDIGLDKFLNSNYDYLSNVHPATYPDGYDVEIFSFKTLENAWKDAKKTSEREHVTPYIWNHPELFKLGNWENEKDYSQYRLTVDEKEDFELVSKIILQFKSKFAQLSMKDVIGFLEENKKLAELNAKFERNEGYLKSLKEDSKK